MSAALMIWETVLESIMLAKVFILKDLNLGKLFTQKLARLNLKRLSWKNTLNRQLVENG